MSASDDVFPGISFRFGGRGWALGTRLGTGPVVATGRHANALRAERIDYVGPDDQFDVGTTDVRFSADELRHVAVGRLGAYVDGALVREGVRHASVVSDGRRSWLVAADREGMWRAPLSKGSGMESTGEWEPLPVRRGDINAIAATAGTDGMLAVYGIPDPVLGVCFVDGAGREAARDVRLRLPAPVVEIDTEWIGQQTGVALLLDNGETWAGVLDANGRTRIRPYRVDERRRDGRTPRVLWRDREFCVAQPRREDGEVAVYAMGGREPLFVVQAGAAPLDAAFLNGRFHFAWMDRSDGEVLAIESVDAYGGALQRLRVPIVPPERGARMGARIVRERLVAVEVALRGRGYRDVGGEVVVRRDEDGVAAFGATVVRIEIEPSAGERGQDVVIFIRAREEPAQGGVGPFPRLRRFFGIDRDLDPAEERFVATLRELLALGDDATLDVVPDPSHVGVRIPFEVLPAAAELARWLRELSTRS